jgi:hypothetical protein
MADEPQGQDTFVLADLRYIGDQLARIAEALEALAPAQTNGLGEVLGRTVMVDATLHAPS